MKSWFGRNWKLAVNVVTLAALAILIFATRHQIGTTVTDLGKVHASFLLLLIPIELLNYHAQTKIYQRLFDIVGNKFSYKFLFRASLELNFVNHVFPSGGVTGISYFTLRMRNGKELTPGKATLIHMTKIVMYILAYEIILIFGAFALTLKGRASGPVILITVALSIFLIILTFGFMYIVGKRSRINSFFTNLTRFLNRLIRIFKPSTKEAINIDAVRSLFDDFHDTYRQVKSSKGKLIMPFFYSFLADATEVAAVVVVYMAFGKYVNLGAIIIAYAIANFAGLISVLPGGVGIYEGLMTAVLAVTGISPGVSLPITVMYRVLNTLLQVPPGYYLYNRTLSKGQTSAAKG
jgi:uncharacterized protein (TIRG00374 family)